MSAAASAEAPAAAAAAEPQPPPSVDSARVFTFAVADDAAAAGDAAIAGSISVRVQETDWASGGLGWRVWGAAHVLSRELCAAPALLRGAGGRVLEIGAGCGLCGFVASALGAREVVLSDALPALLHTLAASAALQAPPAAATLAAQPQEPWAWPGMRPGCRLLVRTLLWDDDAAPGAGAAAEEDAAFKRSMLAGQLRRAGPGAATAPTLPAGETFPLVIGSDLLYDWGQRAPLARVLRARLAPGGVALLALPVRDKPLLDAFCCTLSAAGLGWDARPSRADPSPRGCRSGPAAAGTGGDEPLACVDLRCWHAAAPPPPALQGWPGDDDTLDD
jgi:predicted nicotinamide N-methyase